MKIKLLFVFCCILASTLLYGAEIIKDSCKVVFGTALTPEDAKKVSETGVLSGKVHTFSFPDSMIYDLRTLFKKPKTGKSRAIIYFTIRSEKDVQRVIGLSADYWFTCYLNGEMIGTTEPGGERDDINPYNRGFNISLKKGLNRVALHTRSGAATWEIGCRLFPDFSEWPAARRDREKLFQLRLVEKEKIIGPKVIKVSAYGAVILYYKGNRDAISVTYWKKGDKQNRKTLFEEYVYGRLPQKNLFRFELKNLEPATDYCYELRPVTPGSRAVSGTFRTAPADGTPHTLVAISDTQTSHNLRVSLVQSIVQKGLFKGADLLVSLGDVASEIVDFEKIYFESFLNQFRAAGVKAPYYPVRGNHEYRGIDTDRYADWFGCPYYSFRYGDVFYIVLDTGEDKPRQKVGHPYTLWTDTTDYFKAQREWLRKEIKTEACRTAKFRIVLAHAPPFEWEKPYYAAQISKFADCFFGKNPECRIDLWLCGDIHCPYRFDPLTGDLTGAKRVPTKRKTCELTAKDRRDIHFPVYVNDGPRGAGQTFSVTRIAVRNDSLLVTCTGADGTLMDQIVIRPGKPFEVLNTTYKKYTPYRKSK
ncbi:MAG: metallophosphoesterase [Lentisphaeria bacterium]|nr:metallophosphoesterase [Lentisphaeria bacterium]